MRLENYYEKYNLTPLTNEQIVNAVLLYETCGKTPGVIGQVIWPEGNLGQVKIMMNKVIQKYALHVYDKKLGKQKIVAQARRDYWLNNDIGKFIMDLHKQLVDDISIEAVAKQIKQDLDTEYKLASDTAYTQMYNADDQWFKHYTKRNKTNYWAQKSMAKKRGIAWEFNSFEEWLLWWLQTGKFNQRGVYGHTYHMCRVHDTGPYRWDNVYYDTGENNQRHKGLTPDQDTLQFVEST